MAAHYVDLNADVGEGFGAYAIGDDEALMQVVTSVNVACGFHAGDPRVMARTVQRAARAGLGIGAHVGYPDRVGFGRRAMALSPEELRTDVLYQIGALAAFCRAEGVALQHVKPHGALYHAALYDEAVARAVVAAVASFDPGLVVLAIRGSRLAKVAEAAGLAVAWEGFVDRRYRADGGLVARGQPGAVIEEPERAAEQAVRMVREGRVRSAEGVEVETSVHTLCIHGDQPGASAIARAVRRRLEAAGVQVGPLARHPALRR
ncbi:LamB/YcsF family protein [Geochorda subterranea]|uniref:5-oxoprolinase subunit A n=1 Tax=Geochorda subterranea TaxID=3109564 RepID=A0ABZ1BM32_9FIRM|nr:5-oxoprolinase subunit PxpA [Limnochorda sp. LNt]WRP13870.1 5-oxoprolinase subunit PxpA [Limnochorda sp. LNt]